MPLGSFGEAPIWGSDLVVSLLRQLGIEYFALVPGASFRGLHDSLVNFGGNSRPEIVLCNHEMVSVALARGYARVTGRPIAVGLHDLVGLTNAGASIYDAWADRTPVVLIGGNGPNDAVRRRPWIDWIHTASAPGSLFRDFLKWDDEPSSLAAIPQSVLRAFRIATTEPAGPTFLSLDLTLQESLLPTDLALPEASRFRPPSPLAPDEGAIRTAAALLAEAELPIAFAGTTGSQRGAVQQLVALAEELAMPVIDDALLWQSFPTGHPLDFEGLESELAASADVVLTLGAVDVGARLPPAARVIQISLEPLASRGFAGDTLSLTLADVAILASPAATLERLHDACRRALTSAARGRIEGRQARLVGSREALDEKRRSRFAAALKASEISPTRLAHEVWKAVREQPFTFTSGNPRQLGFGLISIAGPEENVNGAGGAVVGNHTGSALGAALGLRDSGRLPVAVVGDGDLLMAPQALWTAAHHSIPGLWIVQNNRSYGNDQAHQEDVARDRDRPAENSWIGIRLERPTIDFAALARSLGVFAIGPVREAAELPAALVNAAAHARNGEVALVDVWT